MDLSDEAKGSMVSDVRSPDLVEMAAWGVIPREEYWFIVALPHGP